MSLRNSPLRSSPLRNTASVSNPVSILRPLDIMYPKFAEKHGITHDDVIGIINSHSGIFVGTLPEIHIAYSLQRQKGVEIPTLKGFYAHEQNETEIDPDAKYAIAYDPTSQCVFRLYKFDGHNYTFSQHSIESLTQLLDC